MPNKLRFSANWKLTFPNVVSKPQKVYPGIGKWTGKPTLELGLCGLVLTALGERKEKTGGCKRAQASGTQGEELGYLSRHSLHFQYSDSPENSSKSEEEKIPFCCRPFFHSCSFLHIDLKEHNVGFQNSWMPLFWETKVKI